MIPINVRAGALLAVFFVRALTPATAAFGATPTPAAISCLESDDGYLHAKLAGAIETTIDWPNAGTRCQGESRSEPAGVRLSFQRPGTQPDLLFVFGLTGIARGVPAHAVATNLTIIVQGTPKIYGTQGDSRCTIDSLTQSPAKAQGVYRIEARGFCIQPAHAIRGNGAVLMSTFEFAGVVAY
jgi:hypothetical protein